MSQTYIPVGHPGTPRSPRRSSGTSGGPRHVVTSPHRSRTSWERSAGRAGRLGRPQGSPSGQGHIISRNNPPITPYLSSSPPPVLTQRSGVWVAGPGRESGPIGPRLCSRGRASPGPRAPAPRCGWVGRAKTVAKRRPRQRRQVRGRGGQSGRRGGTYLTPGLDPR